MSKSVDFFAEAHQPSDQPWFVEKLVRFSSVTLVAAAPNSMKTWSALDLAARAITGGKWLGQPVVGPQAVMLVSLDSSIGDVSSQFRRLTQTFSDRGASARGHIASLIRRFNARVGGFNLATREHVDALVKEANSFQHATRTYRRTPSEESKAARQGTDGFYYIDEPITPQTELNAEGEEYTVDYKLVIDPAHFGVGLIIIDALSTCASADQNAAEEMATVMDHLRLIAERTKAAVLVLHHNRKMSPGQKDAPGLDAVRGSGVITAIPETVFAFNTSAYDESVVEVVVKKQRGVKLEARRITLLTTGDADRDNEHALEKYRAYQKELLDYETDETRPSWDPEGEHEPKWSAENLYPAPWPYATAEVCVLNDASPKAAKLIRHLVSVGGSSTLEAAAQWALHEPSFSFNQDTDAAKAKAAKNWVMKAANAARDEGWLESTTKDTRGLYTLSQKALAQYGATTDSGDQPADFEKAFPEMAVMSGSSIDDEVS